MFGGKAQLVFWSEFSSAFAAQVHSLCASVTAVYLPSSHRLEWEDRGLGAERKSVQDERENPPPNSYTCESEPEHNRLFERPREVLMHRARETITDGRRR